MVYYPDTITLYPTRIDKNASGWAVTDEYFNVPGGSPYTMYLDHVPKDSATTRVYASGDAGNEWTEVAGTPAASGEFMVSYDTGLIEFYSGNANVAVEADYETLGDDIMAEHMNNMQGETYGIENSLGLGIAGGYSTLALRLSNFSGGDIADNSITSAKIISLEASKVTCTSYGTSTYTNVQDHIAEGFNDGMSPSNPHGIEWEGIFETAGSIDNSNYNISASIITGETIVASGNAMYINWDGPDADQYLYFYDSADPSGQSLKWDDGLGRFELSGDLYIDGTINASFAVNPSGQDTSIQFNDAGILAGSLDLTWDGTTFTTNDITASGVVNPDASGNGSVGEVDTAWGAGYFDILEASTSIYAPEYYGDGSNLTGINVSTAFTGLTDTPSDYTGFESSGVYVNQAGTGLEFLPASGGAGGGGGASDFLALSDTPGSYGGFAASGVRVNTGETGLEFYEMNSIGTYVHEQRTPAAMWTANHGLNTEDVIVQCTDDSTPKVMVIPEEIEYTTASTVTITFESPYAGEARIIAASGSADGGGSGIGWGTPVDADIIPYASGVIDLGSPEYTFNDIYADTVYASGYFETDAYGMFYWGDPTSDGTWRITREGDNLVVQRRESTYWVTKSTFTS